MQLQNPLRRIPPAVVANLKNKDNSTGEVETVYDNTVEVNDFFQNYNQLENVSKIGEEFYKLSEGKTSKSNKTFLENAISIWYNNFSLSESAYIFEIERGSNKLEHYPERIITLDNYRTEEARKEKEKIAEELRPKEEAEVEQMPQFPGGQEALMKYLSENVRYPVIAQENGIEGRVICSFVVERDGSITDVQVVRGVDPSLDREAVRVI